MAKYQKKPNYREKYPDLSDEVIEVLKKSDRKMEYQQYDIKADHYRIDYTGNTVTYAPSQEDSYDRLVEENYQFPAVSESVENMAVNAVMIEKMLACLKLLAYEEQALIYALYFKGKSEREYGDQIGISQKGVSKRKYKILDKLKKLMKI
ncbi:MAG: polymerase sigma factor, sigma-70 family [Bacillota bacterium]|jgi:RNA polymerase sigma factor (sigma-70 family)|nr:polymerase sigma factor, sigma-70 family [Bacillota bacterium]